MLTAEGKESQRVPIAELAQQVPCPWCKAKIGEPCIGARGPWKTTLHVDRRQAAREAHGLGARRRRRRAGWVNVPDHALTVAARDVMMKMLGEALVNEDLPAAVRYFAGLVRTRPTTIRGCAIRTPTLPLRSSASRS